MIHIVIVDDEADTHLLYKMKFKKIFANMGELDLVSFLNGPDCIRYLSQANPPAVDLILTDINMPDMDGFELLQRIHELNPKIPVYMVSAYESSDFRLRASHLGASQFLSKPVDFHQLRSLVSKELNLKSPEI